MLKAKILSQGRTKEQWLLEALAEYEKRLSAHLHIEWVLTDALEEACLKEKHLIALDVQGDLVSSEALSRKLASLWVQAGSRLSFVIGEAEGLSDNILRHAMWRWSLSRLTFTHQMTRLILVEQLYRALEIQKGSKYHK
ncbi:MAG: 23S rRNA (pseudouridine(1915)-N(3))-methyltransferase RlmH [Chlamydiia bacterium]|nr:23S rRNA (pseudouridine(1915)-N(3))-methyltransferase RlmH [Chlamydiia bacterium]